MFAAKKLQGAGGAAAPLPSDPDFNSVSFLSHFDGANNGVNNVFDDGSASNHTITANGNVTQGSFGPFARPDGEWSGAFGSGNYLTAPVHADFTVGTGNFTVEFWIYPTDFSQPYMPVVAIGGDSGALLIAKSLSGGEGFGAYPLGIAGEIIRTSTLPQLNSWTHVLFSRSGTSVKLFYNGVEEASSTSSYDFTAGGLVVGSYGGAYTRYWGGNITNLRYVKGTATVTSNFTPPTAPLTAITNTKLLTCQSNRFVDNSASAHTITASGNPAVSAFGPFLTSSVYDPAVNAASAYFGGDGDYLSSSSSSDFAFGTGDFTVDFWFYLTASSWRLLLDQVYGSLGISIWINPDRELEFYPTSAASAFAITAPVDYNVWNHVALVRSSGVTRIYANGVSGATYSDSNNYTSTAGFKVASNYTSGTYGYEGYISNVRAVKGTAVYTSNFTPPTAPTTAITNTKLLLNMADGQAIDSAAQNNLTLYGNAKISSTQSKFGGTSMYFDGTEDYAYVYPKYFTFGTSDFTLEFQLYLNVGTTQSLLSFLSTASTVAPHIYIDGQGANNQDAILIYYVGGVGTAINGGGINTGQWYHVALSRSGTSSKLFIDGTQVGTTYSDSNNYVSGPLALGTYAWPTPSTVSTLNGYIDEVRISKMARYTSNFTPPTEPFPDIGE